MKTSEMRGLGRETYDCVVEAFYVAMNNLSQGQGEAVALELEGFLNRWNRMSRRERDDALAEARSEKALRDFNERHDKEGR